MLILEITCYLPGYYKRYWKQAAPFMWQNKILLLICSKKIKNKKILVLVLFLKTVAGVYMRNALRKEKESGAFVYRNRNSA